MFNRIEKFIGKENLDKIKKSRVAVVGLGGVGGYAVECLVRSGIENMIILDYDKIDISNLNRQLIATSNNISNYKVDEWEKRIKEINKNVVVRKLNMKLDYTNIDKLFSLEFEYLIDAIDDISMKEEIIKRCLNAGIKIISSMGTGNKIDPTCFEIVDIKDTSYDPIAKRIRKYLKDNNIKGKLPVVYSREQNEKFLGSIPSMVFTPATSGILCANYIIREIINK